MGGSRSKASQEEILGAFSTEEPFKATAARLGLSPNTLRGIWKDAFGEEAFTERGKRLQAKAAAATARSIATTRVYQDVRVACSACGNEVLLKSNQVAQMHLENFLCDDCKYDQTCPVCDFLVSGERGLAGHFRHRREAGDEAHILYLQELETARWAGDRPEVDYVVCAICSHCAESLARHIKAVHGITADEYKTRYPGTRIRSIRLTELRSKLAQHREGGFGKGDLKEVVCPSCGVPWKGSKFLVPGTHDLRCVQCRERESLAEETVRWQGKSEPDDFVQCRVCGWKGENLTGHLSGAAHPKVGLPEYRKQYPEAPLFILSSYQFQPSANKCNLTEADLAPFKDTKGRVQVALAAEILGCCGFTVRNYCKELGLPTRNRLALQKQVLDALATLLGEQYQWEWNDPKIGNPKTGYRFYFDGYYKGANLLVEVNGKQHYVYIPYWHKERAQFEALQERDVEKRRQAAELGYRMLTIRYDEPYTSVDYLKGRLVEMGVLSR
jgi:hypothetical protein